MTVNGKTLRVPIIVRDSLVPRKFHFENDIIPLTIPMLFQRGFDWTERAAGYPIAPIGTVSYDWAAKNHNRFIGSVESAIAKEVEKDEQEKAKE